MDWQSSAKFCDFGLWCAAVAGTRAIWLAYRADCVTFSSFGKEASLIKTFRYLSLSSCHKRHTFLRRAPQGAWEVFTEKTDGFWRILKRFSRMICGSSCLACSSLYLSVLFGSSYEFTSNANKDAELHRLRTRFAAKKLHKKAASEDKQLELLQNSTIAAARWRFTVKIEPDDVERISHIRVERMSARSSALFAYQIRLPLLQIAA